METQFDPRIWRREHQAALCVAGGLGFLAGSLLGLLVADPYTRFRAVALICDVQGYGCSYLLNGYWLRVLAFSATGTILGAGIVYIRQLLRA